MFNISERFYLMKKIFAVNGSPRNNGNTAKILQHALTGAESAGAETELINLGKLNFSGCRSCFACKLKGGDNYGRCALNDDLTPFLNKLIHADGIIMGTPVYFSAETGLFRNFMERLFFPLLKYSDPPSSLAPRQLTAAFVYTMNIPEPALSEYGYREHLEKSADFSSLIFGAQSVETLYVCDTWQFDDYSKYDSALFDPAHKAAVKKEQFPIDKQRAFELGRRMALK